MLSAGTEAFTTFVTSFQDQDPAGAGTEARIYVPVIVETLGTEIYAMVDTGAAWPILNPEIAREAHLNLGEGQKIRLSTRLGKIPGELLRATLTIPAVTGEGLEVDATVFVPETHWSEPNFLGYRGFLERIRFAVDPIKKEFHFGPA
jgi:hypothetical protein